MIAPVPVIVIGASAGGVEAVTRIASALPPDLPAAVFVAMHFPSHGTSVLPQILSRHGALAAGHPQDGEAIVAGRIYVAPPDRHLLVHRGAIRLVRGPKENGNRPAIDPMFRSAAVFLGSRVIGVILTGNLDDGTAGLLAVKRYGGVTIVQDPRDAVFASMPLSAIEHVDTDFVLRLDQIPATLVQLARDLASTGQLTEDPMPDDAKRETEYAEMNLATIEDVNGHPGVPSQFGCPDCGGVLWEIKDGELARFRCRVGHAWSSEALLASQAEQLDGALWVALRALEEHVSLNLKMSERNRKRGNDLLAAKFERDAHAAEGSATVIRDALYTGSSARQRRPDVEAERGTKTTREPPEKRAEAN